MPRKIGKTSEDERLIVQIADSRRWITILFTDIVDSTRHWHEHGDVETRVKIEQHNQALIPLVAECRGKVIKTIGDSIMATFSEPEDAVLAAMAMQHCLHEVREKDPGFELKVRIGIHRGKALVEVGDVFGNAVNVAARIEGEAEGDEILISAAVAQNLDQDRFHLKRRGSFTPRGKTNSILLYRVSWWRFENMLGKMPKPQRLRGRLRRTLEVALYPSLVAGGLAYLMAVYFPHLFAAHKDWLNLVLNPGWTWGEYPVQVVVAGIALACGLACPLGIKRLRLLWLCGLRMGIGFGLGFAGLQYAASTGTLDLPGGWSHRFSAAELSLVEVLKPEMEVRNTPSPDSPVVSLLAVGHRAPLDQLAETRRQGRWIRVHLGPGRFGWLPDAPIENANGAVLKIVPGEFRTLVARDFYSAGAGLVLSLLVLLSSGRSNARRRLASV